MSTSSTADGEPKTPENQAFSQQPGIVLTREGVAVMTRAAASTSALRKAKTPISKPIATLFNTHSHGDHRLP